MLSRRTIRYGCRWLVAVRCVRCIQLHDAERPKRIATPSHTSAANHLSSFKVNEAAQPVVPTAALLSFPFGADYARWFFAEG